MKSVAQAGQRTEIQRRGGIKLKNRLYKIMADFNDVLEGVEDVVNVLKVEIGGIGKEYDIETAKSVLNVHLHLLKRTLNDCTEIYNKIDELLLDMKEDGRGKKSKNIKKWKFWRRSNKSK